MAKQSLKNRIFGSDLPEQIKEKISLRQAWARSSKPDQHGSTYEKSVFDESDASTILNSVSIPIYSSKFVMGLTSICEPGKNP